MPEAIPKRIFKMNFNAQKDYFKLLEVNYNATEVDIKKAFKTMALKYHPDKNPDPGAEERFKQAKEAYTILSDPIKKMEYQRVRSFLLQASRMPIPRPPKTTAPTRVPSQFNPVFENFFIRKENVQRKQPTRKAKQQKREYKECDDDDDEEDEENSDSENKASRPRKRTNVTSSGCSENAKNSTKASEKVKKTHFNSTNHSRNTNASQKSDSTNNMHSSSTDHTKKKGPFTTDYVKQDSKYTSFNFTSQQTKSSNQNNNNGDQKQMEPVVHNLNLTLEQVHTGCTKKVNISRKVVDENGTERREEKTLEIKITPGWKTGTRVTFQKEGDRYPGLIPSDIVFILQELPHELFKRDGYNILHTARLSIWDALCGDRVEIPTLGGVTINYKSGKVIKPGTTEKFQGFGLPNSKEPGKRGDFIVTFEVDFPEKLTDSQIQGLRKLFS